ncbi:hypothetical protein RHSIM_RhsimPtG0005000 (chloroplast) [Rhododendron simsii]|uniref:Uncharacterized protein n=3 Tax=Rhododendron TaxID=4346 RepID=A0A834G083_RHOSS|nr:hypothetical protein RHSIM_RhsimPtG0005000 [Rhododendron simsii]
MYTIQHVMDKIRKKPIPSGPRDSVLEKNQGHLVQIIDPVLDVAFPADKMPKVYNVLLVQGRDTVGQPINVRCEVLALLRDNRVLAIPRARLSSYRRLMIGMKVFDTGAPLYTEQQIEEAIEKEMKMTVVQLKPPYFGFDDSVFIKPSSCVAKAITINAPEQLGNIQVPKRASYIRVIILELSRIASHLLWLGPFMADIGTQTPFFYIFRERELIYDLFEAATGMRMMHNYFRIGGIAADLPHGWIDKCLDFCDYFLRGVAEYQKLITRNPIFLERVEGAGVIGGEEAINWGLSGPMLRASGIQWDLRKVDHYECYDEFDWEVKWQKEGDSLARYLVRIGEMTESIKIIQQALEGIPGGPYENLEIRRFDRVRNAEWNDFEYRFISKKPSPTFEFSKQELYVRVEAPKGELGIFLIGDQNVFPWRWKIRPPGFVNLQVLPQLVKRMKLADILTILGSIDIIMGEVDR